MRILSTVAVCLLFALMLTGCNKGPAPVTKPVISEEAKAALDELREFAFQRIDPSVVADHMNQVAEKADALRVAHPDVPADETDFILLSVASTNRQYSKVVELGDRFVNFHLESEHRPAAVMTLGYAYFSLKEYEKAADCYSFHAGTWPDHAQRDLALNNAGVNLFFAEIGRAHV